MQIIVHTDNAGASTETQETRQEICNFCIKYNSEQDTCSECECLIARKKFYVDSTCPLGKW